MNTIESSIKKAFEITRDSRITYNLAEAGSASLLTGVFPTSGTRAPTFYSAPDITNDETTKLAIIYGKVMITPFLVDAGVISSTNDPSSILKQYNFIFGDGSHEGVVPGPNGSTSENIYIIDKNKAPKPVLNGDGTASTGNVVLASILGPAVASVPKLWDAAFNTAKADPTKSVGSVDPVTGKSIPTPAQKTAAAIVPALDELRNVSTSSKGQNDVLAWDPAQGMWVVKNLNSLLSDVLSSPTICGGAGGAGGSGGHGGSGGTGGTGGNGGTGEPVPVPPVCSPTVTSVVYACDVAPTPAGPNGMVLLPTLVNTANNEYTQTIPAAGTTGIEIHTYYKGQGRKAIWSTTPAADCPVDSDPAPYSCLVQPSVATIPNPSTPGQTIEYYDDAEVKLHICLTTVICGTEVLFYSTNKTTTRSSSTAFSEIALSIMWADTILGPLLTKYPGQIFTGATPTIKLYISRKDECGSEYPVYFEGYKRFLGNVYDKKITSPTSNSLTPQPKPPGKILDDGKFPDIRPAGGALGAPSCPEPVTVVIGTPGSPGSAGTGGTSGVGGTGGSTGTCGTIDVGTAKAQPKLAFNGVCAKQYGTKTTPPAFDKVHLTDCIVNSGMANQAVTLVYTIDIGNGAFSIVGSVPGGVTATPSGLTLTISGPAADVQTTTGLVYITPADNSLGELHYKAILTNADSQNAGVSCALIPQNLAITDNQSACSKLIIDVSTTGGTAKVTVKYNGATKDLTNGYVSFNTSINQTATDIAANITANVAIKNALAVTDAGWLPKYVASATTDTISICSPTGGGCEWNGANVDTAVTGAFSFSALSSIKTFLGGACKTVSDFVSSSTPQWGKVSDVLFGLAGNVAGAMIVNTIMNNSSKVSLTIPEQASDTKIAFLYKGLKVSTPTGYDGTARTGGMTYDAWVTAGSTWTTQWTDNPIWCLYDYITNRVYGLGNQIQLTTTQRTALLKDLFSLALYVDQLVTDEDGNPQVRFSLNTVITDGSRLQVIEQICSNFRGSYVWHYGGIRVTADREDSTISLLVNQSNAGAFSYNVSSAGNITNMINLTYVEPSNFYKNEIVQAKNNDNYKLYGQKSKDITYFGCTNASQAIRQANWYLLTEKYNTAVVSYPAGEDHFNLVPGQIVQFADSVEDGVRRGGRVISCVGTAVVLDGAISASAGDYFSVTCQDGTIHSTTIVSISGVNVILTAAPGVTVNESAVFIAAPASTGKQLYKVIKNDETNISQFGITLQLYKTEKFATV